MKVHFGLLFPVLFILIALISCQLDEQEYSCDPAINKFVRKNLTELSQLNISELNTFNISLQKAIFNSWDYKKKREAWMDKIYYILNNNTFSEKELLHIQKLEDHITGDYFTHENIDRDVIFRSEFAENWITYATDELCFSDKYVAFLVYRLYMETGQLDAELSALVSLRSNPIADSENSDCGCNQGADFCGIGKCISDDCTLTSSGCGWLWSMPCDGNCY